MTDSSSNWIKKSACLIAAVLLVISLLNNSLHWQLLGLSSPTFSLITIFLASLILWLFVAIDWPSLLCLICLGLLPGSSFAEIFQLSFGNTTFVFLFFTFILTFALQDTPCLKRVLAKALNSHWAQASTFRFIFAFLTSLLLLACFISPTILFMIAFSLYEEMVEQFQVKKGDPQASKLLVALFSTIAIGTAMTPINHVFAITAMGIYQSAFGQAITNAQYMTFAIPSGLILYALLWLSLVFIWRLDVSDWQIQKIKSLQALPDSDSHEKWVMAIFSLVVALWLLPELLAPLFPSIGTFFKNAGIAFPPMLGVFLLATLRPKGKSLISLQTAIAQGVYWPSLLIVAATLSLGSLLTNPQFAVTQLIQDALGPVLSQLSPWMVVGVFIIWAGLQTNFSSNLVTTTMVTTLLTTLVTANPDLTINAAVIACLIGFMASLALMTPPAMPYVAISIGSGWTSSADTLKYGGWILILSILTCCFIAYPLGSQILSQIP
ncbi:SLC13 family permease [Facklamia hominis]